MIRVTAPFDRYWPDGPLCPECGSDNCSATRQFDFGMDSETGHRDCGTIYECKNCNHTEAL